MKSFKLILFSEAGPKNIRLSILIIFLSIFTNLYAQRKMDQNKTFYLNSPEWVQTGGPGGGYINDIAIDPTNPSILYATGPSEGIYKSINGGNLWNLIKFPQLWGAHDIEIDPNNTSVLYCNYDNFSKSTDAGLTWQNCTNGFGNLATTQVFSIDPINSDILYMAGHKLDGSGVVVFKTQNSGQTWQNITGNLNSPTGSNASALAVLGNGKLFFSINDGALQTWHKGKVFYSDDDGVTWREVNFGQTEDRFIFSIFVNPFNLQEVWISEGPLYNNTISQPYIYKSSDGGIIWNSCNVDDLDATQVRIIGSSSNGRIYISGGSNLVYTNDGGNSSTLITPPLDKMVGVDYTNIAIHPSNPSILFLPLRAGGIAYSEDGGVNWVLKNNGILNTSINLLAADPIYPSVIYSASTGGEGTFRSDDYGESWVRLNAGGIVHPWGDELTIDPVDPSNVWFIPDVPYIHKSMDKGNTWEVLDSPYTAGDFNFCSVYAVGQSSDNNIIFALNNGFGIFKGTRQGDNWDWKFLNLSEIDYTYSIAVHPTNPDIVYSGYLPKPFQEFAMVRKTIDGGDSWQTVLDVPKSTGIVSVIIDPSNSNTVYAGSTGERGEIYKSTNGGNSWSKLNEHFTMCTVWGQPQLIIQPDNPSIAYVATWLGGTWKTEDAGATWTLLENAPISSTALSLNALSTNVIYLADRTTPTVWKSMDAGKTWGKVADFSSDGALLVMRVLADGNTVYASTFHPALRGARLYKSMNSGSDWNDITGTLPKGFLDIAVDPINSDIVYVTTNINGAHKSTDGGTTWTQLMSFPDVGAYDIEIDPLDPTILYTSARGGFLPAWFTEIAGDRPDGIVFDDPAGVYKSTDAGSTWTQILTTSASCRAIRQHPDDRNMLFAVDLVDGLQVSTDGGNSWISCNTGLDTEVLTSCAVGGDKIYVGTQGCGVYSGDINMSTGAITWQPNRSNKPVPEVYSLQIEVDPTNSNRIFVGSNPGGLYRSDDGGVTFRDKNGITPSVVVEDPVRQGYYTFAINPSNTEEMWLGTWGKGIFKSYNAMNLDIPANGTDMKMYGKHIFQIVIDPNPPNTVYVASEEGVYKSSDGGENWIAMNGGLTSTDVRVLYMNSNGELYAGTRGYGLFKWENGYWEPQNGFGQFGVIWSIWDDRPLYQYTSVLIHPQDNSRMLIGTFPQGIYTSIDRGATWKESNVGWTMDGVFYLVCHPQNSEIVYAGTYNGINRSLDFGEHWEMWDNGMPLEQWVFSINFDPTNPDIMYACSKNGENEGGGVEGFHGTVMKSLDSGANWFEITNGLDIDQEFYQILVDKFDPNTIYLAAQRDGMFISKDAGNSWTPWNEGLTNHVPGTNGNNVTNMLVLSADHSILYFGSAGSGVFRRMITPVLPVNNLCAEVKNHQIILKWQFDDLNNNFSHYNIYRSNTYFSTIEGFSPYASISNLSDTTFSDSNVKLGIQYYYTITTVDVNSYENDHIYVLGPVVGFGISVTTTILDTGYVGINYVDTLEVQGGQPPYSWELTQGSLPPGLSLSDSSGSISGIPTVVGKFNFIVKVSDSESYYGNKQLTLVIKEPNSVGLDDNTMIPDKTMLHQNYPNPFNTQTTIDYQLRKAGLVTVEIYDVLGQRVRTLINLHKPAGYYNVQWDGRNDRGLFITSGIYFYEMKVGDFWERRKFLFLK